MNNKTWESALTIALLFMLLADQWSEDKRIVPMALSAAWGIVALGRLWRDKD